MVTTGAPLANGMVEVEGELVPSEERDADLLADKGTADGAGDAPATGGSDGCAMGDRGPMLPSTEER